MAALRLAAERHGCFALLRSGGNPGIMYVEGSEEGVKSWVSQVRVSSMGDLVAFRSHSLQVLAELS